MPGRDGGFTVQFRSAVIAPVLFFLVARRRPPGRGGSRGPRLRTNRNEYRVSYAPAHSGGNDRRMTMRRTAFALLLLATALATSSLFAAQHREVTTVEVVQVPVYVSVDGKALTGLTRGDFELYVNCKQQPLDYFDVIDFAGLPAEAK